MYLGAKVVGFEPMSLISWTAKKLHFRKERLTLFVMRDNSVYCYCKHRPICLKVHHCKQPQMKQKSRVSEEGCLCKADIRVAITICVNQSMSGGSCSDTGPCRGRGRSHFEVFIDRRGND